MGGTPWGQSLGMRPGAYVEPLDVRGKVAAGALALFIVGAFYSLLVDVQLYESTQDFLDGSAPYPDILDRYDAHDSALNARLVLMALCAATFLFWFHRAWKNAIAMGVANPSVSTTMAVVWWFVPFASIVMPKNVANDIYRGSDPDMPFNDPAFGSRPVALLLHLWWAAWLIHLILLRIAQVAAETPNDAVGVGREARLFIAADVMGVVAAALAIGVVMRITNMSEERRRRFPDLIPGAVGGAAYGADRYAAAPQAYGSWAPPPPPGQPTPSSSQPPPPPQ